MLFTFMVFKFYIFTLRKEKNRNLACISSKQIANTLALNPQLFCQQIDKKHPLAKRTAKYVFFIGAAIKIAVLVSRRTTSMSFY